MDNFYIRQATRNINAELIRQNDSTDRPFVTDTVSSKERRTSPQLGVFAAIKSGLGLSPAQTDYTQPFVAVPPSLREKPDSRIASTDTGGRVTLDQAFNKRAIWGKSFGENKYLILFGARDWKGNVWKDEEPVIEADPAMPYGYRLRGFKDELGRDRAEMISQFLLNNGLPTEYIVRTYQVKEVIFHGKCIPIQEWRKLMLSKYRQEYLAANNRADRDGQDVALKKLNYIRNNDFYISDRDLQVPERVADLDAIQQQDLPAILQPVFDWLYAAGQQMGSGLLRGTAPFPLLDANKEEDQKKYLTEWLPCQMGIYLARLHNLHVIHNFAHEQNWSLAGTLYDLDTPRSVRWGNKMTGQQFINGIKQDGWRTRAAFKNMTTPQTGELAEFGVGRLLQGSYSKILAEFSAAYIRESQLGEILGKTPKQIYKIMGFGRGYRFVGRRLELM